MLGKANEGDRRMKKIILVLVMGLVGMVGCDFCEEEKKGYQGIYFYVQYPGSHAIFFHNTDPDDVSIVYVFEGQGNYAYTEDELVPLIGEINLINIRIHKVTGSDYPDLGNLTFSVYDQGKQIDQFIIPLGETRVEVNYLF